MAIFVDDSLPPEVVAIVNREQCTLLKAWRLYRGLSVYDVSSHLRVWPSSFESWERYANPCNDVLYRLAKLYECRISEMID